MRGPNVMFSSTVNQSNSALSDWKTTPRSLSGLDTLAPLISTRRTWARHETRNQIEQRRLAAARRPEQAEELARLDLELDVLQHDVGGAILRCAGERHPDVDACGSRAASLRHDPRTCTSRVDTARRNLLEPLAVDPLRHVRHLIELVLLLQKVAVRVVHVDLVVGEVRRPAARPAPVLPYLRDLFRLQLQGFGSDRRAVGRIRFE